KKVQQIMDLLAYIRWTDFSTTSSYQITREIAGILARISQMNDPMAGKIIASSASNLGRITNSIKTELKTITEFLRERYKAEIREKITSRMKIDTGQYRRKPGSIMDNVKFEFSHKMKKAGWYKELVHELLEEDYGVAAEKLQQSTLDKLKSSKPSKRKKSNTGAESKASLMNVLNKMARTGEPIRSSLLKMNENSRVVHERKRSFSERLSEIFSSLFSKSDKHIIYNITIKDQNSGSHHIEALNYTDFSVLTMRKARLLQELQDPDSIPRKKAQAAETDRLVGYVNSNLTELKNIHRRLNGLDEYFQSDEIPPEIKNEMKSSSYNMKNLKSAIAETIKAFNEFKIKKEEAEQLEKLGITD
ncbi:MAG: hypothetical protein KAH21_03480, partial [Spirochaetaceae bacterium]|nr:hypothetical protein [Spirochaetaceae bacterium]